MAVGLYRETLNNLKTKLDQAQVQRKLGKMLVWAELMDEIEWDRKVVEEWIAMTKLLNEVEGVNIDADLQTRE